MKKIIFSLVLFKQTLNEIMPLLNSIADLNLFLNYERNIRWFYQYMIIAIH